MNPGISAGYPEIGRWLNTFAASHAKRESPRFEAIVDAGNTREGRSYGLRLVLGDLTVPPVGEPPIELGYTEVTEGRTRFAWCEALARRVRTEARRLVVEPGGVGSQSA